ncbi:MAG: hypothetical protein JWO86_3186 [Myxococcaceae bacterium]|jgi:hypothetical protein|nr:hypothetical protein [Myxococcaceae bacterium]MEA2745945.1 hypothetical protein [Myxococcales bacterium]
MLFVISALGIIGAFVMGLDALVLGSGAELEHIVAIACLALGAAGLVGAMADDGLRERSPQRELVARGAFQLIAAAPIIALSVGVFVATLIPSLYVAIPFFAVWWYASPARRAARARPVAGEAEHPLHAPAYA